MSDNTSDIVERLRDGRYNGQEAMRAKAADEIERLRKALEPFAREAAHYDATPRSKANINPGWKEYPAEATFGAGDITIGDLRRARNALARSKAGGKSNGR